MAPNHHTCTYVMQSVLDLRIMRKDCKLEAKVFDNSLEEIAYTVGQVSRIAGGLSCTHALHNSICLHTLLLTNFKRIASSST